MAVRDRKPRQVSVMLKCMEAESPCSHRRHSPQGTESHHHVDPIAFQLIDSPDAAACMVGNPALSVAAERLAPPARDGRWVANPRAADGLIAGRLPNRAEMGASGPMNPRDDETMTSMSTLAMSERAWPLPIAGKVVFND